MDDFWFCSSGDCGPLRAAVRVEFVCVERVCFVYHRCLVTQASDVCLPGRRFAVVLLAISRFPVGTLQGRKP